jgi:hypothetical protein
MNSVIAQIVAEGERPEIAGGEFGWPEERSGLTEKTNSGREHCEIVHPQIIEPETADTQGADLEMLDEILDVQVLDTQDLYPQIGDAKNVDLQMTDPALSDLQYANWEQERRRRIYRSRTVAMLRRYMKYSMETGRLPSVLGSEFFRSHVTSYGVSTFEDRVIFVHDMEICLERLDEFSRQLIARHILQEHDQEATARLLGCADRTVRTYVPIALDLLSGILLEVGLMDPMEGRWGGR